MKKTFLILILFLIGISFFEAKALDCPTGFIGTYTTTLPICSGCEWVIEWCCLDAGVANVGEIYIKSIYIRQDDPMNPCPCIQTIQTINGERPVIPWSAIFGALLESEDGCFDPAPNIPPCTDGTTTFMKLSNGGCYEYFNDLTGNGWRICGETPQLAYCYSKYTICYEFEGGQWRVKVEPFGPPTPNFQCENDCESICQ